MPSRYVYKLVSVEDYGPRTVHFDPVARTRAKAGRPTQRNLQRGKVFHCRERRLILPFEGFRRLLKSARAEETDDNQSSVEGEMFTRCCCLVAIHVNHIHLL